MGLPQCMLGYTPPWEQTPREQQTRPWSRHTPLSRPPPTPQTATAADSYCCGWYASYRNAFLWNIHLGCLQGEMHKTKHMIYVTDDTQVGLVWWKGMFKVLPVAEPGFTRRGMPTAQVGAQTYCLARFLLIPAWKGKKLDEMGGGGVDS